MKKSTLTIDEFLSLNSDLVSNCFTNNLSANSKRQIVVRARNLLFVIHKNIFVMYCITVLLIKEPVILLAQLVMWGDGGLRGSYQFHRLYEIRRILKKEQPSSAIEFGTGASSLLFNKYVKSFVTIEESDSWAQHYLQVLSPISFLPGLKANIAKLNIQILPRLEFADSTRELVCSYEITSEIRETQFDLAYIDGPTSGVQTEINKDIYIRDKASLIPNITVLELSVVPRIILVDGRRATVSYLISKGGFGKKRIHLRGTYAKQRRIRPYHTLILT